MSLCSAPDGVPAGPRPRRQPRGRVAGRRQGAGGLGCSSARAAVVGVGAADAAWAWAPRSPWPARRCGSASPRDGGAGFATVGGWWRARWRRAAGASASAGVGVGVAVGGYPGQHCAADCARPRRASDQASAAASPACGRSTNVAHPHHSRRCSQRRRPGQRARRGRGSATPHATCARPQDRGRARRVANAYRALRRDVIGLLWAESSASSRA